MNDFILEVMCTIDDDAPQKTLLMASILGRLSFPKMELLDWIQISGTHKFEGIALFAESAETISFLLCEDPDDGSAESTIYKLTLPK